MDIEVGLWETDRNKTEEIINISGIAKLKDTLEKNRIRWFGHIMRMGEERLPKIALKMKLKGKKPVGRPRIRREDQVKRDVGRREKAMTRSDKGEKLGRPR